MGVLFPYHLGISTFFFAQHLLGGLLCSAILFSYSFFHIKKKKKNRDIVPVYLYEWGPRSQMFVFGFISLFLFSLSGVSAWQKASHGARGIIMRTDIIPRLFNDIPRKSKNRGDR
jgi:hypothetical protein